MKAIDYILSLAGKDNMQDEVVYTKKSNVKRSASVERQRPDGDHELYWDIYRTDPIAGASVDFTISFVLGAGIDVTVVDLDGVEVKLPEFDAIVRKSKPRNVMQQFLKDGFIHGNGYIELMKSPDGAIIGKFGVVPATEMRVEIDGKGIVEKYVQELGESEDDFPIYEPHEIVHYRNRGISGEPYGRSDIEPITEVSEILRDMMIDLANFISAKAYPPIVWIFGTPEKPWHRDAINQFMSDREEVEPGDQIGVQGDITHEVAGVGNDTLDIQPYLTFFASMEVSGMRVPATLTSIITDIGQFTADAQTNAYNRRINDIRSELSELLENDLFNRIIEYNGYGDNYRAVVKWKKHDDESMRMAVNNIVQLVQNRIITIPEARAEINFPMEYDPEQMMKGSAAVEKAEPEIPPESDENTSEDTVEEEDGRHESRRENFEVE